MKLILVTALILFGSASFAETPAYCNGQTSKDNWGVYYPNGQKVSDNWGVYYPNGKKLFDNWGKYYPNGQILFDNWGTYYPNKQVVKDNWGVYYHNGQVVRDSWGCYYSNGAKMYPCSDFVRARMQFNETTLLTYTINVSSGQLSIFNFEEKFDGYTMFYDVDLMQGHVQYIDALCE